jgi:hypothetical protein
MFVAAHQGLPRAPPHRRTPPAEPRTRPAALSLPKAAPPREHVRRRANTRAARTRANMPVTARHACRRPSRAASRPLLNPQGGPRVNEQLKQPRPQAAGAAVPCAVGGPAGAGRIGRLLMIWAELGLCAHLILMRSGGGWE